MLNARYRATSLRVYLTAGKFNTAVIVSSLHQNGVSVFGQEYRPADTFQRPIFHTLFCGSLFRRLSYMPVIEGFGGFAGDKN